MESFEEQLSKMSLPETGNPQHRQLLLRQVAKLKEERTLSLWWISIPLFMIAAFYMRSFYIHNAAWASGLEEFLNRQKILGALLFAAVPGLLMLLNIFRIKKIHFLSGSPALLEFIGIIWLNLLQTAIALVCIAIYFNLTHFS